MDTKMKCRKMGRLGLTSLAIAIIGSLTGCATSQQGRIEQIAITSTASIPHNPPGVVNYIWEEPMVNVVDVPPGLDPEGIYYRPSHQAVVEIRQGRWKHLKSQGDN